MRKKVKVESNWIGYTYMSSCGNCKETVDGTEGWEYCPYCGVELDFGLSKPAKPTLILRLLVKLKESITNIPIEYILIAVAIINIITIWSVFK